MLLVWYGWLWRSPGWWKWNSAGCCFFHRWCLYSRGSPEKDSKVYRLESQNFSRLRHTWHRPRVLGHRFISDCGWFRLPSVPPLQIEGWWGSRRSPKKNVRSSKLHAWWVRLERHFLYTEDERGSIPLPCTIYLKSDQHQRSPIKSFTQASAQSCCQYHNDDNWFCCGNFWSSSWKSYRSRNSFSFRS